MVKIIINEVNKMNKSLIYFLMLVLSFSFVSALRVNMIENTPLCLSCHTTYEICNDDLTSKSLDKNNFELNFYDKTKINKVSFSNYKMLVEKFKTEYVLTSVFDKYKEICSKNGTENRCYNESTFKNVNELKVVSYWESTKDLSKIINSNSCFKLKIEGNIKPFDVVDNILKIDGYEFKDWAMWNGTELNMTGGLLNMWNLTTSDLRDYINGNNFSTDAGGANVVSGKFPVGSSNRHFNSGNEYFKTANYDTPAVYSISFWLNRSATSSATANFALFGDYDGNKDVLFFQHHNSTHIRICGYSTAYNCIYMPSVVNSLEHFVVTRNTKNITGYANGVYVGIIPCATATGVAVDENLIGSSDVNVPAVSFDELYLWNRELNISEVEYLYNNSYGNYYPFSDIVVDVPPVVTFISQSPPDINTTNSFAQRVNITYSITDIDETGVNLSKIYFMYQLNSTIKNPIYVNGTKEPSVYYNKSYSYNLSNNFSFLLNDNEIFPGTYNYNQSYMENSSKSFDVVKSDRAYYISLLNVSPDKQYGFLEIYAEYVEGNKPLEFYFCNSSIMNNGDCIINPLTNNNCTKFYELPTNSNYSHSHSSNSKHFLIPFPVVNGKINNVGINYLNSSKARSLTPNFFYITTKSNGKWNIFYINKESRYGTSGSPPSYEFCRSFFNTFAITNLINQPTGFNFTPDFHLHQFNNSDSLNYYVCASDTANQETCSANRYDLYELGGIPPTSPNVYLPNLSHYPNDLVQINFTNATSPSNTAISSYVIYIANENGTAITTLNNTLSGFLWNYTHTGTNTSLIYTIKVVAFDYAGLNSSGTSSEFTIGNTNPSIDIITIEPFLTNTRLNCSATFTDNDYQNVSINFTWLVDGTEMSSTTSRTYYFSNFSGTQTILSNYSLINPLTTKLYACNVELSDGFNTTESLLEYTLTTSLFPESIEIKFTLNTMLFILGIVLMILSLIFQNFLISFLTSGVFIALGVLTMSSIYLSMSCFLIGLVYIALSIIYGFKK